MAERDLHTAFQHLTEDVMKNVQTDQQLAKITERRTWVRPGLVAFAGAAAVVLLVGAALLALRPGNPTETVPPATGSTLPPTTVVETTSPPAETSTTTIPAVTLPNLDRGTIVVAQRQAGDLSAELVDETTVVVNAERVVGEGADGLFAQIDNTIVWLRPNLPLVALFSVDGETISLLRLEDASEIDGEVHVVAVVGGGIEEQRYEEVWIHKPSTGEVRIVYRTGAYEGGITRASVQNGILAVTRHAEGFSWFEFVDLNGQPVDVSNPRPDDAEFPVFVDQGVLSPDGTTMVYVEGDSPAPPEDGNWRVDLIAWDLATGSEIRRTEVELGNWYVDRMDFDGTSVVIGRTQWAGEEWVAGPALRVAAFVPESGPVSEIAVSGPPSLIK